MNKEHSDYKKTLRNLQIELVKLQRHIIKHDHKILVIFEGRDAAGKDGTIKRIIQHLSPRETRVVALGKPNERERSSWYFQRFAEHLPAAQEMVLMNRSWYNRAGVERVMGFCTDAEYEDFMTSVVTFEQMLVRSGIQIIKYYLDISRKEQKKRLDERRIDPLKQWKISPIDEVALEHWHDYSAARNEMFERTHNPITPWHVVRADSKKEARLNVIRHLIAHVECPDRDLDIAKPDHEIIFSYHPDQLGSGQIAK
ncbi:polyphosphate kinase 2 [Emcibacter nanhaiensis]|uniref:ADP/GDP-polyphosphate phosphotransferase n=1 Tax=Emcibacter nanhaiensis TaxID=1505037 RepID=A0A501PI94_9PROT|nr:polyphosphate kinase 2 [Emcibacter nanhaiensis]TPD59827.1 polyphosphate kinase 2 [Emcibacter nanhaiensis]